MLFFIAKKGRNRKRSRSSSSFCYGSSSEFSQRRDQLLFISRDKKIHQQIDRNVCRHPMRYLSIVGPCDRAAVINVRCRHEFLAFILCIEIAIKTCLSASVEINSEGGVSARSAYEGRCSSMKISEYKDVYKCIYKSIYKCIYIYIYI